MELLEDIRFYNHTGKIPTQVIREAVLHNGLFDNVLEEGQENTPERVDVLNKINNDTYIKNNYKAFLEELKRNKRAEFLTPYTVQDFINAKVQTFQVPGYEIGFALKPMANGDMDSFESYVEKLGGLDKVLEAMQAFYDQRDKKVDWISFSAW
jgi:hypothetical protein